MRLFLTSPVPGAKSNNPALHCCAPGCLLPGSLEDRCEKRIPKRLPVRDPDIYVESVIVVGADKRECKNLSKHCLLPLSRRTMPTPRSLRSTCAFNFAVKGKVKLSDALPDMAGACLPLLLGTVAGSSACLSFKALIGSAIVGTPARASSLSLPCIEAVRPSGGRCQRRTEASDLAHLFSLRTGTRLR